MTILLSNQYEEVLNLFDELDKSIFSESKAKDNQIDELKKIIDEAVEQFETEPLISNTSEFPFWLGSSDSPFQWEKSNSDNPLEGESSTSTSNNDVPILGENPISNEGSHADFQVENENNDSDVQSEFQDVNAELDPSLGSNYPPLAKWTKYHPRLQVIWYSSSGVLIRAQQKVNQTAFSKLEFLMFNSFI